MGEGIRITMTRAEHSSEYRWTNPETQQPEIHVGGEPAGFIIELENGLKIYHMGDTGLLGDLGFNASYFRPDLVLIPIGGHFTMDPKDAALTTREHLKPRYAIPVHYGTKCPTQGQPAYSGESGHPVRRKAATGSDSMRPVSPAESGR
jgi:L-ascorbate metabolism protein UlaG (beta-lactamase superfamily)